jgi:hypothetical protein
MVVAIQIPNAILSLIESTATGLAFTDFTVYIITSIYIERLMIDSLDNVNCRT